ncbi:MAG: Ig-like domain-containing protein [Bacteroidaceae bacterium]|nr:Ig-like domain-containing protein [Bacteroidaceae bacterium]
METKSQQTLQKGYVLQGKKNRYIIDRVLGQGAFGITYLARYKASIQGDIGSGSVWAQVAIKEFFMRDLNVRDGSTGYLNDSSQDSLIGRYRRAFMREARNLAGLHHDNIVNVFEVIEANNTVYIIMEYINGGSLDEHIAQSGKLSEQESVNSILKLCSAVSCMHEHRMLHLDIKPRNVMLDEDGQLYLIDFGLSKQYTADGEPESSTSIGLGTPGYAPVEQAEHQDGDKKFRATIDVYALGATMYKMLTGQTPPKASQVSDSVIDSDNIIPKQLKDAGISDSLTSVVAKAMWPSSGKRYQSVSELVSAIDALHEGTIPTENDDTVPDKPKPVPKPVKNPSPEPKPKSKPKFKPEPKPTGFPKWLYGVAAALLVGLIVFLAIPKSKAPQSVQPPVSVTDTTETTSSAPVPAPTPESKPDSKPEPKTVALTSISLSKTSLTLEEGATSTLTVRYTPSDATDKSTTWKSTDTKVATVSSSGKVTAVKAGSATIIATSGSYESSCKVTVESRIIALSSISLDKTTLALEEGASSALYIEYSPSNASDKSTTWESTNTNVAIVDYNGTVTAVGAGDATIIATCGKLEKTCRVTVEAKVIPLTSISLNKTSLSLEEGSSSTLTVYYSPSNATDKSIKWKSSDPGIATVSNTGVVTAVKAGSADIVAYSADGIDAFCNITVTAKDRATGTVNGHEWIDLGLSVKWATCNIGASSPSAYGDYYAWGETSTKSSYTWENYRFRTSGDSYDNVRFNKYNTQSGRGTVDNRTTLELSDDVARQKWGGSWRMPTYDEFRELINNCTWTWTTMNGVSGFKVTSKKSGYSSRSIFLPAAGYRGGTNLSRAGEIGFYWSSSLDTDNPYGAWGLHFYSGGHYTNGDNRYHGRSVRPVCP